MKDTTSTPENDPCWDDEIDLRELVRTLLKWWWLTIGIAMIAALSAFVFSSLKPVPEKYQVSSTVVVMPIGAANVKMLSALATSDSVMQRAYEQLRASHLRVISLSGLKGMMKAKADTVGRAVILTVTSGSADTASQVLRVWRQTFLKEAQKKLLVLNGTSDQDMATLRNQIEETQADLQKSRKALLTFQIDDKALSKKADLESLNRMAAEYEAQSRHVEYLLNDISLLKNRLAGLPPESKLSPVDALMIAGIATNVMSSSPVSAVPSGTFLSDKTNAGGIETLNALAKVLQAKKSAIQESLSGVWKQANGLRVKLLVSEVQEEKLQNSVDLAQQKLRGLDSKLVAAKTHREELQNAVEAGADIPQPARVPTTSRRSFNTVLAGIVGLMLGMMLSFVIEWWRGGEEDV